MGKNNRKSIAPDADNTITSQFDVKDAIRVRIHKMLKASINSVMKLDAETPKTNILILRSEMESRWNEFMRAFEEVEAIAVAMDLPDFTEITNDFVTQHNLYIKAKIHATVLLDNLEENGDQNVSNSAADESVRPNFKLAPLRISPFSGDPSEWIEFKATCNAILTVNLKEVQRLQLLKDALFGEARLVVSHVLPGQGAFDRAMELLKNRYENQRLIINHHLKEFYALEKIATPPSSNSFRLILNTLNSLVSALQCYEIDTSSWNSILIFHIVQRFEGDTLTKWEETIANSQSIPTLKKLLDFLQVRITVRQTAESVSEVSNDNQAKPNKTAGAQRQYNEHKRSNDRAQDKVKAYLTLKETYECGLCNKNHLTSRCTEVMRMSLRDRQARIAKNKLCENCFYPHPVAECPFKPACKKCDASHNTMLHPEGKQMFLNLVEPGIANEQTDLEQADDDHLSTISKKSFYHLSELSDDDDVLLTTAIVPVIANNHSVLLNALVDDGSTGNLITVNACKMLNLHFTRLNVPMVGVGDTPVGRVVGRTMITIGSTYDKNYTRTIKVIVVRSIGGTTGIGKQATQNWKHLHGLTLANPKYYDSFKFDLLLGNGVNASVIMEKIIRGEGVAPIARQSKFGWLVSGETNVSHEKVTVCRATTFEHCNDEHNLSKQLREFWELEEVSIRKMLTPEEQMAEKVFSDSVRRAKDGKFIVDLPFKMNPKETLGESFPMAIRRYKSLQRRLDKNPQLKEQYDAVLEEYLTLNHMQLVTNRPEFQCFLPHHEVIKESSTTTKVRVVFDASAKTSTGVALNECLCVGAVIQPELFELLISWRKFEFAVSADIEKMYRMMYVNPHHADCQTILWHRPGTAGILAYKLLTVTFGTSSAPFQATRGLYEVGERIKESNPKLAETIQRNHYVDDFLKSFPTIDDAQHTNKALINELSQFGFNLRQWKSNESRTLDGIDKIDCKQSIDFDSTFKTLGIAWHAHTDNFVFKSIEAKHVEKWTKRQILSVIAKLFDPLGWLSPCIVRAKLLMQDIWRLPNKIDWDSEVPSHIMNHWQSIYTDLTATNPIEIPRWLKLSNHMKSAELHAFCDASKLSYACCVYLRVQHVDETISCNLIAAKTKVSPIRVTTIPRLELCGALLASKLVRKCANALAMDGIPIVVWCDSKIVLAWLATHPSKWATFVAHRTSEIHENIDASCWRYVPTKQNPADIASRGTSITEIKQSSLWWQGPSFLSEPSATIPNQDFELPLATAPEKCKQTKSFHINLPKENYVLEKFESLNGLLHFTALALRLRDKIKGQPMPTGPIVAEEMNKAESHWIRLIQLQYFGLEISKLKSNRGLPNRSPLMNLNPFVDADGILRMNGRVQNVELIQQTKAVILPSKSHFVFLVIRDAHENQVNHGGVQLTLRAIRNRYWVIHARSQVNKMISRCIVCFRAKKRLLTQKMANLPLFRTVPARPFTFTGCDFAGPFQIKVSESRKATTTKGYVALFICLTTKAVHLEVAGDLSMAEYVMAFENFVARRGTPSEMYTDNGTNLVGGEREIRILHEQFMSQTNQLTRLFAAKRIKFKRIPARASHMGGIWERAVGLMKYHLTRVMKNTKLTTRRFDHVLKQIECSLNSRPLWAVTHNADDIEVITPSHFFNFEPINTLPRPDISHVKMNRLDQYQYLHRLYLDFWKSWSKEYVELLQTRQKWQVKQPNIKIGNIVVISDDNLPPSRWSLGRVVATYPGKDGSIRVVDVKCGNTILKRPIHRLGLLPILENDQYNNQLNASKVPASNGGENVDDFSSFI